LRQRKDQKEKQLTKTKNKKIQTQSINKNEAIKIPTPKEITENKNMFGLLNMVINLKCKYQSASWRIK
jgi:hypothetical protein